MSDDTQNPVASDNTQSNIIPFKAPQPSTNAKPFKILVVEDEEDSKDVLVSLLNTNDNYEVSSSADGQDALAKLEAERGTVDLVLLDIVMPRLDGVETLRLIKSDKSKYGEPSILMLTNLGGDVAVETAMNLGAQGYLMKVETEPDQLLKRVESELEKKNASKVEPVANTLPRAA